MIGKNGSIVWVFAGRPPGCPNELPVKYCSRDRKEARKGTPSDWG